MGRCNYCTYQSMLKRGCRKATEAERKKVWNTQKDKNKADQDADFEKAFGPGVVIVDKDGNFASWFMELPDHCVC